MTSRAYHMTRRYVTVKPEIDGIIPSMDPLVGLVTEIQSSVKAKNDKSVAQTASELSKVVQYFVRFSLVVTPLPSCWKFQAIGVSNSQWVAPNQCYTERKTGAIISKVHRSHTSAYFKTSWVYSITRKGHSGGGTKFALECHPWVHFYGNTGMFSLVTRRY